MHRTRLIAFLPLLLTLLPGPALTTENTAIDDFYRAYFRLPEKIEKLEEFYRPDFIHAGRHNAPLTLGRDKFLDRKIRPLRKMIRDGQLVLSGKAYIVRRVITDNMANDVGYLYLKLEPPKGEPLEQLQKFSRVFIQEDGQWKLLTEFDGGPAPLALLETLEAELVIE